MSPSTSTSTYRPPALLYEMQGPIGMGWPQDDAYARGLNRMNGYHVVAFDESGALTMLDDRGTETNFCGLLD